MCSLDPTGCFEWYFVGFVYKINWFLDGRCTLNLVRGFFRQKTMKYLNLFI